MISGDALKPELEFPSLAIGPVEGLNSKPLLGLGAETWVAASLEEIS